MDTKQVSTLSTQVRALVTQTQNKSDIANRPNKLNKTFTVFTQGAQYTVFPKDIYINIKFVSSCVPQKLHQCKRIIVKNGRVELGSGNETAARAERLKSRRSKAEQTVTPHTNQQTRNVCEQKKGFHTCSGRASPPLCVMSCCHDLQKRTQTWCSLLWQSLTKGMTAFVSLCLSMACGALLQQELVLAPLVSSTLPVDCLTKPLSTSSFILNLTESHTPIKKTSQDVLRGANGN